MGNRLNTMFLLVFSTVLVASPMVMADENTIAAFAFGRGGAAAKEAVNVQHMMRELINTTGSLKQVDFQKLLSNGEENERQQARTDATDLLAQGKGAYDELELEKAQSKFQKAIKKFEYGYGYLTDPGDMIETLMFIGATFVLAGEPEKSMAFFKRAAMMSGKSPLNENLFPPNIQEVLNKAKQQLEASPSVKVRISSKPYGAEIYLDGTYVGGAPLTIADVKPGPHMVRALKDGFMPWGGKIMVKHGAKNSFKLSPKPLVKRRAYSSRFGGMSAELIRGKPGPRTEKFMKFLGADRLLLSVLDGEPTAMAIRAYSLGNTQVMSPSEKNEIFDIKDPGYSEDLKQFLLKLMESGGKELGQGAKEAEKNLVSSEESESEDDSFGLDLSEDAAKTEEKTEQASDSTSDNTVAEGKQETSTELENTFKDSENTNMETGQKEEQGAQGKQEAKEADKVIKEAGKGPASEQKDESNEQFAFTWTYLHDKWWFWTAAGVLVAGAATGTYFAITTGSDEGGGTLVLGLH